MQPVLFCLAPMGQSGSKRHFLPYFGMVLLYISEPAVCVKIPSSDLQRLKARIFIGPNRHG
jgi:hypothetical protein